jgi:uncharacterized membrane protein YraQ (UPF0718 family)
LAKSKKMKNNKFFLAALAGTVTFLLIGFLVFGKLLKGFFETNSGLPPDVMAQVFRGGGPNVGAMIFGQVALGLLYARCLCGVVLPALQPGPKQVPYWVC